MQLAIVLFAVVVAVSAHPGLIDPWGAPQVHYAPAHHQVVLPAHQPTYVKQYVQEPVHHYPEVVAHEPQYIKVGHAVAHAPVAVHPQYVKVAQPPPIPALHPQPLNIKVPHTQSVRLPLGAVKIHTPHLIGVQVAAPEPEPVIQKHAVVHKAVHPVAVAHPVHPW
ncbi:splicing factor 3A subunit 2-like [Athalia rosae]|uniref:splicing factor 3A subunit 2-like n=1 Tax=Athalia rosae TaxID=37344 RepID=UPI0006262571|nr:splicing factor 3A subunit 2-like [Athalia rosae]